jgi:hypothetical protein
LYATLRAGLVSLAALVALSAPAGAQRTPPSPAMVERDRLAAELRATAARLGRRDEDGLLALDRAADEALRPIACRWALAVAALTPEERRRLRAREGDEHDPRAGVDGALVGASRCDDPVDTARVRLALGAPGWARMLLEASAAHRTSAAAFEATLAPADATLLATLRAAQGDARRLEAMRPAELARLVGELTGQRCRAVAASTEELWDGDEAPAPGATARPFSAIVCEAPFEPDFGIAYGLESPYCDNVTFPRSVFLVHAARGRARIVAELAQAESDSWAGFQQGERVADIARSRGAIAFVVQTAGFVQDDVQVNGTDLAVCSPRTGACRWAHVADGDAAPAYTLTDMQLTVGSTTVDLRDWLADTGPTLGRAERARTFPVPFRWAQRNDDGTRNTEAERCTFVVRDPDGTLNVRSEPDQRSRVLGTVPAGAALRAVWVTRSWLRIEQPMTGWIFRGGTERRCER